MRTKNFLTFCLCLSAFQLWAVKAKPGVVSYIQENGEPIEIILHGDENFHFATDRNDNLLLIDPYGFYQYAVADVKGQPILSGVSAKVSSEKVSGQLIKGENYIKFVSNLGREAKKQLGLSTRSNPGTGEAKYRYSTSAFPTTGTPHSLVILVEYPDYGFNVENPLEYFQEFLNGDNFNKDGATGSCRQFYSDNSNGMFIPTFDVFGPVMLKNIRSYYGGGNEYNAYKMVVEGVEAIDDYVDFSQYDHNNDGYVDSVYIIYADKGEADGGPSQSVWPYSWELVEEGVNLWADGVRFNTYACSNELQADNDMEGIGTFTHEFGHVVGLPDLYNTVNSRDYSTPCEWSVMDSGSYNNDSRTPCNFSSFERYSLGWLSPEEILKEGEYELENLSVSNQSFIMTSEDKEDEFFLLENRVRQGWDKYLPAEGMLVWHIDFVQSKWDLNVVNNTQNHQYIRLVRADNSTDSWTQQGDPFPGSNKITEFGTNTVPKLQSWLNADLNVTSIHDIRKENEKILFSATVTEDRSNTMSVEGTVAESNGGFSVEGNQIVALGTDCHVYDISGRKTGVASKERPLFVERGIYIIDGKKILIK